MEMLPVTPLSVPPVIVALPVTRFVMLPFVMVDEVIVVVAKVFVPVKILFPVNVASVDVPEILFSVNPVTVAPVKFTVLVTTSDPTATKVPVALIKVSPPLKLFKADQSFGEEVDAPVPVHPVQLVTTKLLITALEAKKFVVVAPAAFKFVMLA